MATGVLDRTEGVIRWDGCKWVADTLDGGVSSWLVSIIDPSGQTRELGRWMLQDGEDGEPVPEEWNLRIKQQRKAEEEAEERLHAKCHCGGVKFYITRPNEASKKARSPFPDLITPFHTGASGANPENETW
jgi:hypothetical protein